MVNKLEEAVISLLKSQPYYGQLILGMHKMATTKVPIAAVSITDKINLYINLETYGKLSLTERVGVLVHECKHITHDHIGRSKKLSKKFNKALNVAADRAINELIANGNGVNGKLYEIPDKTTIDTKGLSEETLKHFGGKDLTSGTIDFNFVTVKNFQEQFPNKTIKSCDSMEYYYKFLKENAEKNKGDGSPNDFDGDMDTVDDHGTWEESEDNEEVREQVMKNALKKAADRTDPGNIPGEVKELIKKWGTPTVNWKHELRRFKQRCLKVKTEDSRKKRNRRYGVMYPGFKIKPELHLVCAVDTSASVSTPMLQQFYNEMCLMHRMGVKITVIECDTQIGAEYEFDPRKPFEVTGRGGTSFHPVFNKIKKMRNVDGIIYFTDGECYEEVNYFLPTLWALTPSYHVPKGGEKRHIKIKMDGQE